jgi:Fungal Zn(2)-Cys(6) binuclear cluster domain
MEIEYRQNLSQPQPSPLKRSDKKEFQRAYKACIPCRKRKAKCDLREDSAPPCARCRREHRDCVFSAKRNYNSTKRQKGNDDGRSSPTYDVRFAQVSSEATDERSREAVYQESDGHIPVQSCVEFALPSQTPKANLADSVIRTVVSSGNDALNILFEAAAHQEDLAEAAQDSIPSGNPAVATYNTPGSVLSHGTTVTTSRPVKMSHAIPEVINVWNHSRMVMQGWLSAEEAVTFIDMFFKNMCPLSPIITNYYQNHDHHFQLITQEPLLTYTLLMISSRYHLLPSLGASSRGYFMHEKFWHHCQHLVQRILYGQEKLSKAKTRTIGSIEALLLMSEWHPRALHFPPQADGWDTRIYMSPDARDSKDPDMQPVSSTSSRWLEDVIEPARRSDRMSWMLLGTALTLAHELGVFDDDEKKPSQLSYPRARQDLNSFEVRKLRMRKLLYVYINQLASRLGCSSMFPQNLTQATMTAPSAPNDKWQSHMLSWIELTKLVKSASELFFPSPSVTRQLLSSGRYSSLLDHFVPLLEQWRRKHLDSHEYQGPYQDTLFIEYHYARIYINSIGMEAVCQRAVSEMDGELGQGPLRTILDDQEHGFINEVIDGALQILERTIKLAETDTLRFSPVRTFLRITTSSVFLLKAISLGVRNAKLQSALDTLDRSIQAMRLSNLDDMHLAARYATLLETHVARLRHGFMVSSQKQSRLSRTGTRRGSPSEEPIQNADGTMSTTDVPPVASVDAEVSGTDLLTLQELSADDWLSLPFDPSMAPFGADGALGFPALDANALDFIWNLPAE